jgi:hypothetical protein
METFMKDTIPRKKDKFYYENILASQNTTARPNVGWIADITTLKVENLGEIQKTIYVFLFI